MVTSSPSPRKMSLQLVFFFLLSLSSSAALSPDGLALLAFKFAVEEDPLSALATWNESDADPCIWPGVSCAKFPVSLYPRVVSLSLPGKRLVGYIPSELGSLSYLRRLNLHSNSLSSSIPPKLSEAKSLRALYLYSNNLSGEVPSSLSNLPHLQILDLSRNSLSGKIPASFSNCLHLKKLVLSDNHLSGEVPAEIFSRLGGLVRLDLSKNNLSGRIPPSLGDLNLSLSRILNLSYNRFSGEIPRNLPETTVLDLRGNNLCVSPCENPSATSHGSLSHHEERETREKKKGLKLDQIIAIAAADAVGVVAIAAAIFFAWWKLGETRRKEKTKSRGHGVREEESFCLRSSCFSNSEEGGGGGEGELVGLERGFCLELDELLKASAYVLGKSSRGMVYKVVLSDGERVTVRRLGEGSAAAQRRRDFAAQAQFISRVQHPNIVRLKAFYWSPDDKLLVSEFVSNGSLAGALHGRTVELPWKTRMKIARGIAKGIAHIHEWSNRKLVHGEIKPSNILLDEDFNPKIADFGLHRLANTAGTRPNQKHDVFSFGLLLTELLTGRSADLSSPSPAAPPVDPAELVKWVKMGIEDRTPLMDLLDPAIRGEVEDKKEEIVSVYHLALACTEQIPESRPKMKIVAEFLQNLT